MFDALTKGFKAARNRLAGLTELTEQNVDSALREVRLSLLEADVELGVVKAFLARVKEKALGEVVRTRAQGPGRRDAEGLGERRLRQDLPRRARRVHVAGRRAGDRDGPQGAADRHHDGRPPGLRKDDDLRQARALLQKQGQEAAPRRRRHAAPGGRRAAEDPRRADRRPGLQRPGRDAARDLQAGARRRRGRASTTSSSTTPPGASRSTSRSMAELHDIKAAVEPRQHAPRHRRDDRPGRGQDLEGVPRPPRADRRRPDEARRRRARRRRPQRQGSDRRAHSIRRRRRNARQVRGVSRRGDGEPRARDGRRRRPDEGLPGGRRREGRRREGDADARGAVHPRRLSRAGADDPEDGVDQGPHREDAGHGRHAPARGRTSTTASSFASRRSSSRSPSSSGAIPTRSFASRPASHASRRGRGSRRRRSKSSFRSSSS